MGRLIDGDWHADVSNLATDDVPFEPDAFDGRIDADGPHPPDPERYHLYVSWACPWAHGTLLTRALLGLDDEIGISVVDPHRQDDGWEFTPEKDGCTPDRIGGNDFLREVYTDADPTYTGRVSVPLLWDEEAGTIVNGESDEIMRMLAAAFGDRAPNDENADVDLYPEARRAEIDEAIEALYGPINRGVYYAGFADSQSDHEAAVETVFDALDHWESVLADQRFLLGDRLTLADLRLFATLVRFDAVYYTHFGVNRKRIVEYQNLWGFTRDVFQTGTVARTVDLDQIKAHYYRSHEELNPSGFVPVGPELDFAAPHDRDRLADRDPLGAAD
ncbi:glutathione s-transferase [Salinarchaeum sp. Harcht-Bsk1]|uniref:glutathione S-transferase family protein n=1 Tax=Salinarchaeum sp. Harcht-Bsk1 TaxID=1333523 RepID=UPI0003423B7E|nr:glutathione S-transferase C-terminal domain-containing protein [Salinarchaeum sp. Harcht-Bsk1]AGN02553.1 glutathione s-transferase [Salinarchaeum sp. Harcht-Bsk1]